MDHVLYRVHLYDPRGTNSDAPYPLLYKSKDIPMKTLTSIALIIILTLKIIFGVVDSAVESLNLIENKTVVAEQDYNEADEAQFIY